MNSPQTPDVIATSDDQDEIGLLELLHTVVDNLRLLILGPLAIGLIALGISFAIPPMYTATTTFLPPQQQQSAAAAMLQNLGALGGLAGATAGIKNPNDQYVSLLKSRSLQDSLIQRFELIKRYEAQLPADARKILAGNTQITSGKDGLITVSVDDHDPAFAAELANAHVDELTVLLGRLAVTEAQQRRQFFEKQLTTTKDNLTKAEVALQASGVGPDAVKLNPGATVESVARLQAQITAQEVRVAAMRGQYTDAAPELRQALAELSALRGQLARADQAGQTSLGNEYIGKYRDFKYHETLFDLFSRQYEMARVDESREGALIQVVDAALPPDYKSKPKRFMMAALASLTAGFFLLIFVFARQAMRAAAIDPAAAIKVQRLRDAWKRVIGVR